MKQNTIINQVDEQGRPHGPWEDYHGNGQLWRKSEYKHGKKHGLWTWYYECGLLAYKGEVRINKDRGLWYEAKYDN